MMTLSYLLLIASPVFAGWMDRYRLGEQLLAQGNADAAMRELRLSAIMISALRGNR